MVNINCLLGEFFKMYFLVLFFNIWNKYFLLLNIVSIKILVLGKFLEILLVVIKLDFFGGMFKFKIKIFGWCFNIFW